MSSSSRQPKRGRIRWSQARRRVLRGALLVLLIAVALVVIDFLFSLAGYDPPLDEPKDFERFEPEP